jgi:hypothetical protein
MKGKTMRPCIRLAIRFILVVTLFLPVSSALAASEHGAQVVKDSYCFEYEGSTICYDNMAVVNEVTTPSGNTIFMGNGWSSYSQTDPSGVVVYQNSLKYHTHGLMMDSVLYEFGQFFTYSIDVGGGTCTINYAFHLVNDKIQFERSTTCG